LGEKINMELIKFPSIEQFRNVIKSVKHKTHWQGVDENGDAVFDRTRPLPKLKYQGTVKLHGTNASVVFGENIDDTYFQSRERIITPLDDNAGFAFWADNNKEILDGLCSSVISSSYLYQIPVILYGEWCGANIQKGVAINGLPNMFIIFKIKAGNNWLDIREYSHIESPEHGIYNIQNFKTYEIEIDFNSPHEVQNELIRITEEVEEKCPVGEHFGNIGVGEGVVWSCVDSEWSGSAYIFKVKGEKHSVSKVKKLASVDIEKVNNIKEFVDMVVTENRLNQGLAYLKEMKLDFDVTNTGSFLKWLYQDVVKEESDTIFKSGLEPKEIGSAISAAGKKWYFEQLNKE